MYPSSYDLKSFYNQQIGRLVRRTLQARINLIWPDMKGLSVAGLGYTLPYLSNILEKSERVFAIMPAGQGAYAWPGNQPNLVAVSEEVELPLETNTLDRALLIHGFEYTEFPYAALSEIWRVLKSNGRMLMIVPNRSGLWVRSDWTPFGQGASYSLSQITHFLRESQFSMEKCEKALYFPPTKSRMILRSNRIFESYGSFVFPGLGGVHIIEASKQIYAKTGRGAKSPVTSVEGIRRRRIAVAQGSSFNCCKNVRVRPHSL